MEKQNSCNNNINRNTSDIFNHIKSKVVRNNLVSPEIFVSEVWMQEDAKNGVEIIELNSSNSEVEETAQQANSFSQAWSFVNRDRFRDIEEDYRINEIARERRRIRNEAEFTVAYANEYLHNHDTPTNFNGFHYIDDSEISGDTHGEQMNCFTIINNHVINSESSSENEYMRVEEIEPCIVENNTSDTTYWDHVYKDYCNDIITYDPVNSEKRTVWIYSFKNKRRLSENDFELVNISGKDSTDPSISPTSDEECITGVSNVRRALSPIPATFIPRLDLSLAQTLSTVTELSEAKNSPEPSKQSLFIKPANNWLTDRNIQKTKTEPADVVNWMALSPRERRRRFKNTNSDSENKDIREIFTHAEGNAKYEHSKKITYDKPSFIQVNAEVHATDVSDTTPAADLEIVSVQSFELEPKVEKKKVAKTLSIDITYADADTEIDNERGDRNFDSRYKPCIQLTSDKTYDVITEPIEKLNSSQWIIGDEKMEEQEQTPVLDYFLDANESIENESYKNLDISNSASKRLWMKNTKLMKSPLWTEYLPITGTPPSLHLSLSLSSINGSNKKSWFKRIGKYLNCCK